MRESVPAEHLEYDLSIGITGDVYAHLLTLHLRNAVARLLASTKARAGKRASAEKRVTSRTRQVSSEKGA